MRQAKLLSIYGLLSLAAFSQSGDSGPVFEISDVHVSPPGSSTRFMNGPTVRGGRYEVKGATMVDLISTAYGIDNDRVLGGPNWLEMTRYDIIAKSPGNFSAEALQPALKQLLADRFKLVAHPETKPLPAYTLVAGKKPALKPADGTGETGCKPLSGGNAANGAGSVMVSGANGAASTLNLGPGMSIQYVCRNMTMEAFAAALSDDLMGPNLGTNPVVDKTGMEGRWNFDVHWSLMMGPNVNVEERISVFDAVEKQLGLKLEQQNVPTPVIVVDKVNEKPTGNPPDIAERLKIAPPPTEFDVAAIKPMEGGLRMVRGQVQPSGRVTITGMTVQMLIQQAWGLNPDMLVGAPAWLTEDRWDIVAKVTAAEPQEMDAIWPLVRKLLADRWGLKAHMEERPAAAYNLVAVKPKLKRADPANRAHSQNGPGPDGKDPRVANPALTRVFSFQNFTMAQFADQLQRMAPAYIRTPVLDQTGLEGGYDFTLGFSTAGAAGRGGRGGRGGDAAGGGAGAGAPGEASEPNGGLSLFEAIEKELGLKLEAVKRPANVLVIDHVERKPTDN